MAQIQKGTTYSTGDQVTATNLNALADAAILLPGAITDQTAKTVPLAADTVLIHSAADTALRKSTLTQLFSNATGIPISTAISGLGTGVATALAVNVGSAGAPVVNGGALGTPASGTVTNLTGTASININGTVGATTANTGAFTTGTFSGGVTLNNSDPTITLNRATSTGFSTIANLRTAGATTGGWDIYGSGAANQTINFYSHQAAAVVGSFTSTGLNSTAIGATTASTGAFTTLSASGNITNTRTSGNSSVLSLVQSGIIQWDLTNEATSGLLKIGVNGGNNILTLGNSTGLAVTGALSASGTATFTKSANSAGSVAALLQNADGNSGIGARLAWRLDNLANEWGYINVNRVGGGATAQMDIAVNGAAFSGAPSVVASLTSTGLLVTGEVASSTLRFNRSGGAAWDSNGIRFQIDGTTYSKIGMNDGSNLRISSGLVVDGNVGIGTTSPAAKLHISGDADTRIQIDATTTQGIYFTKAGANNGTYRVDTNGNFEWYTKSVSQAMVLTAAGNLLVGTTTDYSGQVVSVSTSASKYAGVFYVNAASSDSIAAIQMSKSTNVNTSSQVFAEFYINAYNTASGRIVANGASAAAFASYSDRRLKENITDLPSQLNNILSLRPVEFDFKDGSGHQIGFIAQEVEEVYPDLIAKGNDDMLTLTGLSKNEARLIKALQELNANLVAELQSLRQRVAALESN